MVQISDMANSIMKELKEYTEEVSIVMKKAVDKASDDCMKEIKDHIIFKQHTKKYVRNFRLRTSYEDTYSKRKTWYVAGGEHRLTHLLEHGHAKVNGGRTKAFPHIKYGAEIAQQNVVKYIKEELEK